VVDGPAGGTGVLVPSEAGTRWHERIDATGAVYGSLLAGSVIVGQAPLKEYVPPIELAIILLATGAVFWLVHVYSRSMGHLVVDGRFNRSRLAHTMREESPIMLAAVPPAAAALLLGAIGRASAAAWVALIVAIAGQLVWAFVAAREVGAPTRTVIASLVVNFVLGMVLVLLKVFVGH
jgi:hypothetical protein